MVVSFFTAGSVQKNVSAGDTVCGNRGYMYTLTGLFAGNALRKGRAGLVGPAGGAMLGSLLGRGARETVPDRPGIPQPEQQSGAAPDNKMRGREPSARTVGRERHGTEGEAVFGPAAAG